MTYDEGVTKRWMHFSMKLPLSLYTEMQEVGKRFFPTLSELWRYLLYRNFLSEKQSMIFPTESPEVKRGIIVLIPVKLFEAMIQSYRDNNPSITLTPTDVIRAMLIDEWQDFKREMQVN